MFQKKCRSFKLDPTSEFLKHTGNVFNSKEIDNEKLYTNVTSTETNDDNDDSESDDERNDDNNNYSPPYLFF